MDPGKLRHRITIQRKQQTQNPQTGALLTAWVTEATVWAAVEPLSAREFIAAQAVRILRLRGSLGGRRIQVLSTQELGRLCTDPAQVFLGFGFEWRPVHAQRLYELSKVDYREFTVPPWLQHAMGQGGAAQQAVQILVMVNRAG